MKQSNSIRKKEAPNNSKYKLPLAVRTLVIYFCWGGILIVKWKGLCDYFSHNYLLIFFSSFFPVFPQRQRVETDRKDFLQIFGCRLVSCVLWHSYRRNWFCLLLIGEMIYFKYSVTHYNMCCQSKSIKWSRELFQTDVLVWDFVWCVLSTLKFFLPPDVIVHQMSLSTEWRVCIRGQVLAVCIIL